MKKKIKFNCKRCDYISRNNYHFRSQFGMFISPEGSGSIQLLSDFKVFVGLLSMISSCWLVGQRIGGELWGALAG